MRDVCIMKKRIVLGIFLLLLQAQSKAAGSNETALLLQINNTLTQLISSQNSTNTMSTSQDPWNSMSQTGVLATLIVVGQVAPPLWQKVIKPIGGTLIDIVSSTVKKCYGCFKELQKDPLQQFIEEESEAPGDTHKVLWSFFSAIDKNIAKEQAKEEKDRHPLYAKRLLTQEMDQEKGFEFTLPTLRISLTRARDNEAYEKRELPIQKLRHDMVKKFIGLAIPYLKPHMDALSFKHFCQTLKEMRKNRTLFCYDIIDKPDSEEDAIGLEFGVLKRIEKKPDSPDDLPTKTSKPTVQATFSSRYRVELTSYDIPREKASVLSKKKKHDHDDIELSMH